MSNSKGYVDGFVGELKRGEDAFRRADEVPFFFFFMHDIS